jgi:tetratricopeptide (TPR) repeat protein
LQDELTDLIAATIANQLELEIAALSGGRNPTNFACYEHILQGHWQFKKLNMQSNEKAIESYEQALALEPRNSEAMSSLAMCYHSGWLYEFSIPKLEKGVEFAAQAIEFDPLAAKSHAVLGFWTAMAAGA